MTLDCRFEEQNTHATLYFSAMNCLANCDVQKLQNIMRSNAEIDINRRDPLTGLQTILMRLCYSSVTPAQRLDMLDSMLLRKPDINVSDGNGRTVLHHACIGQCCEMFQTLACCDCSVNAVDADGNTPLILAVMSTDIRVVHEFLESFVHLQPNFTHKNGQGIFCLTVAMQYC